MEPFRFSSELFEHRATVMDALDRNGFAWFIHYSSVDCMQDVYGIEVCGIKEKSDALEIQHILSALFPSWKAG